jgi:signal transduction histidine kinase
MAGKGLVVPFERGMFLPKGVGVLRRVLIVALLLALCSTGHLLTPGSHVAVHDFLFKATYLPIILAALWFGVKGGLVASVATSGLYFVHVEHQLGGGLLTGNLGHTLDIVLYNAIALVTGALAEAQNRARQRAEQLVRERTRLNEQLEASYQALQRRTENLLDTEEELRRADRLATLGEMAAGLAHEIRNPLSGLSGAAHVLCRDGVDAGTREEFGAIVRKETEQLNKVVHDFLAFARTQHDRQREADLADLMRRAVESVKTEAARAGVAVVVDVPEPVRIETTPILLEHVLLALLRNAVEAMPDGGTVALSGGTDGDDLVVEVRDMGPGIDPEAESRIFEPFFTTKEEGVGLGLFIARRIVKGLGGELSVASEAGRGCRFLIRLPLRAEGGQASGAFTPNRQGADDGDQTATG